ncbi:nuclear pore complex protein NUP98A-like isoform X2 [Apium graveolens]|uniref:nuclear pore complex protein NUP98A-like isoform X2 n=1 Tax=Apium graveolens TaxID=4045 RepID=UPI003D7A2B90
MYLHTILRPSMKMKGIEALISLMVVLQQTIRSVAQNTAVVQQAPVLNPFGTLPAMPLMSVGHAGTSPSIQYGISSLPVVDKSAPARISSLLTSRHLSQRRVRLPARKYHPKNNGLKVPFFSDDEDTPTTPKADTLFIPRENPREWKRSWEVSLLSLLAVPLILIIGATYTKKMSVISTANTSFLSETTAMVQQTIS